MESKGRRHRSALVVRTPPRLYLGNDVNSSSSWTHNWNMNQDENRALQSHMVTPAGLRFTCRWNGVCYKLGFCSVHSWYPVFLLSDRSRELNWLQLLFLSDVFSEPITVHLKSGFVPPMCVTSRLSVLNSIFHSVTLSILCISLV